MKKLPITNTVLLVLLLVVVAIEGWFVFRLTVVLDQFAAAWVTSQEIERRRREQPCGGIEEGADARTLEAKRR